MKMSENMLTPSIGDVFPAEVIAFSSLPEEFEGEVTKLENSHLTTKGKIMLHEVISREARGDDGKLKEYFVCLYSDLEQTKWYVCGTGTAQTARLKIDEENPRTEKEINELLPVITEVWKPEGKRYFLYK